jgi:hypothetical protein
LSRRNESKIRRNKIQAGRNRIKGGRNKIQTRRNKVKMPVPSANRGFSIGYCPFQRPFAGYDICASGPLSPDRPPQRGSIRFLKSKPDFGC